MKDFDNILTKSMDVLEDNEDIEYTPSTLTVNVGNNVFKCNTSNDEPSETIKIRHGNKIISYSVENIEEEFDIESVKKEVKDLYSQRLNEIKIKISEYIQEFKYIYNKEKNKLEDTKKELEKRLENTNIMPEITLEHLKQGLSVVKGEKDKDLIWKYSAIYHPKMFNDSIIDPEWSVKMITPINIVIKTYKDMVTNITVMCSSGWKKFQHYHNTGSGDCWGGWNYGQIRWSTPDDIINVGKEASTRLEKVNSRSFGNSSPDGLPLPSTIRKHLIKKSDKRNLSEIYNGLDVNRNNSRLGIDRNTLTENNRLRNVWSTDSIRRRIPDEVVEMEMVESF